MVAPITATKLHSFYAGLILSDGYIREGITKRSYRQKTINKDFALYIKEFNDTYTNFKCYVTERSSRDLGSIHSKNYWDISISKTAYFAKLYHLFYDDYRKKYINVKVLDWLDLQGLANFYMADGYCTNVGKESGLYKKCHVDFCTECFTLEDNYKFSELLTSKGYSSKPYKFRNNTYRVRMSVYDAPKFFVDINQYVVPSLKYKLWMGIDRDWFPEEYRELKSYISAQSLANKQV